MSASARCCLLPWTTLLLFSAAGRDDNIFHATNTWNVNVAMYPTFATKRLLPQHGSTVATPNSFSFIFCTSATANANVHFNHLDFHYHHFLCSLLNLVLLTAEPWAKINSLPRLGHQIAILAGLEFSFQTQTFDVFCTSSRNPAPLIRMPRLEQTRDGTPWIQPWLQSVSIFLRQFHYDRRECLSVCDRAQLLLSLSSSLRRPFPSCFSASTSEGKQTSHVFPPLFTGKPTTPTPDTRIMRSRCTCSPLLSWELNRMSCSREFDGFGGSGRIHGGKNAPARFSNTSSAAAADAFLTWWMWNSIQTYQMWISSSHCLPCANVICGYWIYSIHTYNM